SGASRGRARLTSRSGGYECGGENSAARDLRFARPNLARAGGKSPLERNAERPATTAHGRRSGTRSRHGEPVIFSAGRETTSTLDRRRGALEAHPRARGEPRFRRAGSGDHDAAALRASRPDDIGALLPDGTHAV